MVKMMLFSRMIKQVIKIFDLPAISHNCRHLWNHSECNKIKQKKGKLKSADSWNMILTYKIQGCYMDSDITWVLSTLSYR